MPIYEYQATDPAKSCVKCSAGFEIMQRISEPPLATCPACAAPVKRIISAPAIGESKSGLDARAKSAGFHKFQKLGKGEYEKKY